MLDLFFEASARQLHQYYSAAADFLTPEPVIFATFFSLTASMIVWLIASTIREVPRIFHCGCKKSVYRTLDVFPSIGKHHFQN